MTTTTIKALRDALDIALDLANAEVESLRQSYGDRLPHKHKSAADDVQTIKDAIAALTADASEDAPDADCDDLEPGTLFHRLHEMGNILREGGRWGGNEFEYAMKEETDVAMLDDMLTHAMQLARSARPSPVAATPAPAARRDIFAICDAYESGIGHGLQLDGHKSGAIFGNPECGQAYEIGYEEGEERARGGKAAAPAAPIAEVTTVEIPGLAERYSDVLRELASYVGAGGYNSEGMIDPAIAKAKIEWGIDELVKGAKGMSNAAAARWCRENGLNVPEHWEQGRAAEHTSQSLSSAPAISVACARP